MCYFCAGWSFSSVSSLPAACQSALPLSRLLQAAVLLFDIPPTSAAVTIAVAGLVRVEVRLQRTDDAQLLLWMRTLQHCEGSGARSDVYLVFLVFFEGGQQPMMHNWCVNQLPHSHQQPESRLIWLGLL